MRARTLLVVSALLALACSSSPKSGPVGEGGAGGGEEGGSGGTTATGGKPGTGGATGGSTGGTPGGTGGTGGVTATGGSAETPDASVPDAGADAGASAGGTALFVVGANPPIGDDVQIAKVLAERGLKVELILDSKVKVADTAGKALVVLSYSLDSKRNFHENFVDVPVPLIVMEHGLLTTLGMADMHKWAEPATTLTINAPDSPLAAGLTGDVTVYGKSGEMFWGIPSDQAIKVAVAKGHPTWWVIFAYDKGKMMMTKPAPAKRLQFFMGAHLVPDMFMNANGLKLLAASIDWCVK
jgi:hypothetical protein